MEYRKVVCDITDLPEWQDWITDSDIISLYGDLDKLEIFPGGLLENITLDSLWVRLLPTSSDLPLTLARPLPNIF